MNQSIQKTQRPVDTLIAKYAESHLHPTNKLIHSVCVPASVFAFLGLMWALHPLIAIALMLSVVGYYFSLSVPIAIGMLLLSVPVLGGLYKLSPHMILPVSLTIFAIAWVGMFIGHKIEGKKPSFLEDLRFLLIGPLFVLDLLYRRLNIAH